MSVNPVVPALSGVNGLSGDRRPGRCERTFRRCIERCEDEGLDARVDKRMHRIPAYRAPVDEGVRSDPSELPGRTVPIRNPLRNPHVPGTISYMYSG